MFASQAATQTVRMAPADKDTDGMEELEMTERDAEVEALILPSGAGENDQSTKLRGSKKPASTPTTIKKKRKPQLHDDENATNAFIKYAALFLLVAQMVGLVLLMRFSRTHNDPDQPLYIASTAVFIMEVMKHVI